MDRRSFHRLCGGLLGGAASQHRRLAGAAEGTPPARDTALGTDDARIDARSADAGISIPPAEGAELWPHSRLVDEHETPLTLAALEPGEAWIFHYPYRVTPCFLLRLDPAEGSGDGGWPGGLDGDGSVVAFSAICSHKMTHPARPISHIAYRPEPVAFVDRDGTRQRRSGLISCCSERSVYDPAAGARVLSGPAPAPLATIELALEEDGTIAAVASLGQDRYARFLDAFGFRLALEHGSSEVRRRSGTTAVAMPAERFSRQQIRC